VPQIMPPEVFNARSLQRLVPGLGADLLRGLSPEAKYVCRMPAPLPLQPLWHAKRVIMLAKISILLLAETLRFVDL